MYIYIYIYIYTHELKQIYAYSVPSGDSASQPLKEIVSFQSFVVGGTHPFIAPSHTGKAYLIAILLHGHCAIYAPLPTPPFYAVNHTILVMAISCKGQVIAFSFKATRSLAATPSRFTRATSSI